MKYLLLFFWYDIDTACGPSSTYKKRESDVSHGANCMKLQIGMVKIVAYALVMMKNSQSIWKFICGSSTKVHRSELMNIVQSQLNH
ncbi:hypothetical protein H5410_022827 [Solanum commersonii]|uniref:Uncharacterized protein n=1 Tax=Solanum commersonii TaxID=4109 RepID=A0A9J5ZFU7_SOLCO|nr:hypothetical protein H5410_022827 [Solanum commersonii]